MPAFQEITVSQIINSFSHSRIALLSHRTSRIEFLSLWERSSLSEGEGSAQPAPAHIPFRPPPRQGSTPPAARAGVQRNCLRFKKSPLAKLKTASAILALHFSRIEFLSLWERSSLSEGEGSAQPAPAHIPFRPPPRQGSTPPAARAGVQCECLRFDKTLPACQFLIENDSSQSTRRWPTSCCGYLDLLRFVGDRQR